MVVGNILCLLQLEEKNHYALWIGCDEARISYRIVMDFVIKVQKLGFSKESNCMST
jgi:hypothetical protein